LTTGVNYTSVERQNLFHGRHASVLLENILGQYLLDLATIFIDEIRRQHRIRQRFDS